MTQVYILSGFLGSGKTTLLKQLIEQDKKEQKKVAVMMNELGKVSIDSNEVAEDIALKEMLDGCVCCTLSDKLESNLQEILYTKPDVIYIETTGAAHPIEVLDALMSPLFAAKITIKGIITVVDGQRWLQRKMYSPQIQQLILEQVRHADLLLINKTDELSDMEQLQISNEIGHLNKSVMPIFTTFSRVSYSHVQKLQLQVKQESLKLDVKHSLKLSTFVYTFKETIEEEAFTDFLRQLPESIYRIKGYVHFNHFKNPTLFQYSYGCPMYYQENMKMPLNLVFIGENIDWNEINEQLVKLENK